MSSFNNFSAENLKQLRANTGLSRKHLIEQLAQRDVEMHVNSLRRIEEGEQPMKVQEALAFADIFGMGLSEFVTRPSNKFEAQTSVALLELRGDLAVLAQAISGFRAGQAKAESISLSPLFKSQQSAAAAELLDLLNFARGICPELEHIYAAIERYWERAVDDAEG